SKPADGRYQSGQELVRDLEQCNASTKSPPLASVPASPKPKAQVAVAAAAGTSSTDRPAPLPTAPPKMRASSAPATTGEPPAKPSFAVDPMMAEDDDASRAAAVRRRLSEMSQLPAPS